MSSAPPLPFRKPTVSADPAANGARTSVVIPCYRSGDALSLLVDGLVDVLRPRGQFEIILVEDGSPDDTWARVSAIKQAHGGEVRALRLARNVGQHVALVSGFAHLAPTSEIVVTMDDDGQHPPEEMLKLLDALDDSADLVIAGYERKEHETWRNSAGGVVDGALRSIYGLPRNFELTSLRAFRRYLADNAIEMRTDYPYVTAMLLGGTTRRRNVKVRHQMRAEGRSGYTFLKSLRLALNLYFTYSNFPLYAVVGIAVLSFALTSVIGAIVGISALLDPQRLQGWASIIVAISFGNSITLACLVVFGVYVSRFHRTVSGINAKYRVADEL